MSRVIVFTIICLFSAASFASEPADQGAQETITTKSGMQYTSLREGAGASPGPNDTVRVHYRGTLMNGREFDSSYRKGRPTDFRLDSVIKCWTEGLQMMKVGGKARLVCPSNLAYGDEGILGVVPRFATLTFEVELIAIR
jgi:FKBP-type peptidyl-prolyl cis-trans isomerase FkpA